MQSQLHIPEGHQTVMPYLMVKETDSFFEFIEKVFGAKQKLKHMNQQGTQLVHGEVLISDHCLMYGYPNPFPEQPSGLSINVENADETYKKALAAGATSFVEPCDAQWGRFAGIKDQFGNTWWIVSPLGENKEKEQPAAKPYFSVKDAEAFIEFVKKVFNAEEKERKQAPGSDKILHAEVLVAGNVIMVNSGSEESGYNLGHVSVQVDDVDEIYKKALAEGATSVLEPADNPWGRFCGWKDPFGVSWWIVSQLTLIEKVNPYFAMKGCVELMEFVKKVFDAEETWKKVSPEGVLHHGELKVEGTTLMFTEGPETTGSGGISVNVKDVEEVYKKAMEEGAISKDKPTDMAWGKFCRFSDRFGNTWMIKQELKKEKKSELWPYLAVKNAAGFLEFLKKVFNAEEKMKAFMADGETIMHAEAGISGSTIMLSEGSEDHGYRNGGIFVYVPDVDETHKVALAEGATEVMAPCDMSGGRGAGIKDPFGNTFWLAASKKKIEGL